MMNDHMPVDQPRVLVVDDDEAMRRSVERILHMQRKYDVRSLGDGGRAMECIREWWPRLVVLDNKMIGIDGLEILREIRGDPDLAAVRVLVMSGSLQDEEQQQMIDAGADAFFQKPFDSQAFAEEVARQVFGGRGQDIT